MLESEAKSKWCPFARVIPGAMRGDTMHRLPGDMAAHNRVQVAGEMNDDATWHQAMNCLGSDCMAWREASRVKTYKVQHNGNAEEWSWDPTGHRGYENVLVLGTEECVRGYCGLAGNPANLSNNGGWK